jgi:hypothetical protein
MSVDTFFTLFFGTLALLFLIVMCVSISFARKRDKLIIQFLAIIVQKATTTKDFIDCTRYISKTENIIDVINNNSNFSIIKSTLQNKINDFYDTNSPEISNNNNQKEKEEDTIVL